MVTWGLGIEHEFILKFQKKKMINNNYYDLFINSLLIYNLNDYNHINFYQSNKSFIKNNKYYDNYSNLMEDLIIIRSLAIKNERYPFDKKNFFNVISTNSNKNILYKLDDKTINLMTTYLFYYVLYHVPLLFFNYKFNDNDILCGLEINDASLLLKESNDKEELVKYNFDLLKILYENKDILDYKNKIYSNFNYKYNVNRIHGINYIHLKKNNVGRIGNKKDLNYFIDSKVKLIKKYLFNDIKFNSNIIENIFYCYKNDIPVLDGSSSSYVLEMKTIDYKNLNYETTYKNFIKYENSFIEYVSTITNYYLKKYGNINYHSVGSRKESIELIDIFNENNEDISYRVLQNEDYTGSYHLWITIPYDENVSKTKFLNMHANLANKLQLIEPILACNFSSPSYEIKYNKDYPMKLSLRHILNNYSNFGTTDVSLINGSDYTYISDIFFEKKKEPNIEKIIKQKKKVYNANNNLIKNYDTLEKRFFTNNIFNFLTYKIYNSKNIEIKSFYELLFKNKNLSFKEFQKIFIKEENKKRKPKEIDLGADIRTRPNNYMMNPLDDNYKKIYYPNKNKYYEYYLDKNGNLFNKRIYDKEKYNHYLKQERIGIEFRILDHFPTIHLDQILSIVQFLVLESYNTYPIKSIYDTYVSEQFWHNEMFHVIINGYKHNFSKKYINKINKEFNIDIKYKKMSSDLLLEEIFNELNKKYSKLRKYKKLLDKLKFNSKILFLNFNEYATKFIEQNN